MSGAASLSSHNHTINVYDTKQSRRSAVSIPADQRQRFCREICCRGDSETQSVPDHRRKPTPEKRRRGGHSKMPRRANERTQLSDYMTTELQWSFPVRQARAGCDIFLVEYVERWAGSHSRSSWREASQFQFWRTLIARYEIGMDSGRWHRQPIYETRNRE